MRYGHVNREMCNECMEHTTAMDMDDILRTQREYYRDRDHAIETGNRLQT